MSWLFAFFPLCISEWIAPSPILPPSVFSFFIILTLSLFIFHYFDPLCVFIFHYFAPLVIHIFYYFDPLYVFRMDCAPLCFLFWFLWPSVYFIFDSFATLCVSFLTVFFRKWFWTKWKAKMFHGSSSMTSSSLRYSVCTLCNHLLELSLAMAPLGLLCSGQLWSQRTSSWMLGNIVCAHIYL